MTTGTDMPLGQMFMLGFDGTLPDPDHWIAEAVADEQLGGVILFDRNVDGSVQNIVSPAQLRELTEWLRELRDDTLLIGVDQEGGRVCRLRERDGFAATLGAREFAELDRSRAKEEAVEMAAELSRAGINFNLAPVVDLDINPDNPIIGRYGRSFGADPDKVLERAKLVIRAHHGQGIGCCLKHFPGHGSAAADSHLGFVDITDGWQPGELAPFADLIRDGWADAVMTAHVVNRSLDPEGMPATLSSRIISGILRDQLGFSGVVVSDDLQMKAIAGQWGYEEAVRRAVLAGVDLLIVGNNLKRRVDALQAGRKCIAGMLDRGEIGADDIRASIDRIGKLKDKVSGRRTWKENGPTI